MTSTTSSGSSLFSNHESNGSHNSHHPQKQQGAPSPNVSTSTFYISTTIQGCDDDDNHDGYGRRTAPLVAQPHLYQQRNLLATTTSPPKSQVASAHLQQQLQQQQQKQKQLAPTTFMYSGNNVVSEGAPEALHHRQSNAHRGPVSASNHQQGRSKHKGRDPVELDRDREKDKVKVGKQKVSEMVQALELAHRSSSSSLLSPQSPLPPTEATTTAAASRFHALNEIAAADTTAPCTTAKTPATATRTRERDAINHACSPSTPIFYDNPDKNIPPRHGKETHPRGQESPSLSDTQQTHLYSTAPSTSSLLPSSSRTGPAASAGKKEREKEAVKRPVKEEKHRKPVKGEGVLEKRPTSPTNARLVDAPTRGQDWQQHQQAGPKNSHFTNTDNASIPNNNASPSRGHQSSRQNGPLPAGERDLKHVGRPMASMDYLPLPSSLPRPLTHGYHGFSSLAAENDQPTMDDEDGSVGDDDESSLQMEDFFFSGQNAGAVDMLGYDPDDLDVYLGPTNKSTLNISKIKHVSAPLYLGATNESPLRHSGDGHSKISQLSALERLQIQQRRVSQEQQRLANMILPPSTAEEKRAISGMLPTREVNVEAIPALQHHHLFRPHEENLMSPVSPPRPPERPFSPTPPSLASQSYSPSPQLDASMSESPNNQSNPGDSDSAKLDQLLLQFQGPNRPRLPTQLEWQRNLAELTLKQQQDSNVSTKASRRQSQPTPREAEQLQQQGQAGQLKQSKKPKKLNAAGGVAWSLAHLQDADPEDEEAKSRRYSMPEMAPQKLKTSAQQQQHHPSTPEPGYNHGRQNFAQGVGVVRDNGNNQNKRRSGLEWMLQPDLMDGQNRSRPSSSMEGATSASQDSSVGNGQPWPLASRPAPSDKDALDQAFENMLISLSISEAARERLHQLPKDHKWAMIQANDAHPTLYETPDTLPPTYFIEALQSYIPSPTQRSTTVNGKDGQGKTKQSRRHSSSASTSSALSAHDAILQNRKRSNSTTTNSSVSLVGAQSPSSPIQSTSRPFSQSLTQLLGGTKSEKRVLEEREQVLQKLRILIRNGSVRWCKEFFRVGGARALLEFSNYIAGSEETKYGQKERLLYQSIQCLKSMVASEEGVAALKSENQLFPLLRKLVLLDYTPSPSSVVTKDKHGRPQSPAPPPSASARPMSPAAMFYSSGNNNSSSRLSLRPTSPTPKAQPVGRTRSRSGSIPMPLSTLTLLPVGGSMVNLHDGAGITSDKRTTPSGQRHHPNQQQRPAVVMAEVLLSGLHNIQGALSIILTLLSKSPELKETILRETVANPSNSTRPKSPVPHGSHQQQQQHDIGKGVSPENHVRRGSLTTTGPALFGYLSYTEWVSHLNKMINICERDQQARQELKLQYEQALEAYRPRSPVSANGYFYQRRRQTATGAEGSKTSALLGVSGSPPGAAAAGGGGLGLTKILGLRRATSPMPQAHSSTPPSSPSSAMFLREARKRRNSATVEDGVRVLGDVATLAATAAASGAVTIGSDQIGEGRELLACLMMHLDLTKTLMQDMGAPSSLSLGFAKCIEDNRVDESLERLKSYLDATQTFTTMIQEVLQLIALVPPHTTRMNASSLIRTLPERSQSPIPISISSPPLDKRRHLSDDSGAQSHHHGHQRTPTSSPSPSPYPADSAHPRIPSSNNHGSSLLNGQGNTRKSGSTHVTKETDVRPNSPVYAARRDSGKNTKQVNSTQPVVKAATKDPADSMATGVKKSKALPPPPLTIERGSTVQSPSREVPSPKGYRVRSQPSGDQREEQKEALTSPTSPTSPRSPITEADKCKRPSRQPSQRHSASASTASTTMLPVPLKSPRRPSTDVGKVSSTDVQTASSGDNQPSSGDYRLNGACNIQQRHSSNHPRRNSHSHHSIDSRGESSAVIGTTVPEKNPARRHRGLDSVSESGYQDRKENNTTKELQVTTPKTAMTPAAAAKPPSRAASPINQSLQRSATANGIPRSPTLSGLDRHAVQSEDAVLPVPEAETTVDSTSLQSVAKATEPISHTSPLSSPLTISSPGTTANGGYALFRPRYHRHLQSLSEASSAGSTSIGSSGGSHFRGLSSSFQEVSTDSSVLSVGSSMSIEQKEYRMQEKQNLALEATEVKVTIDNHEQLNVSEVSTADSESIKPSSNAAATATTAELVSLDEKQLPPPPTSPKASLVETQATKKSVTIAVTPPTTLDKATSKRPVEDVDCKDGRVGGQAENAQVGKGDCSDDDEKSPIDFDAHIHDNVRLMAASSSTSNLFHQGSSFPSVAPPGAYRSVTPTSLPSNHKQPQLRPFLRSSTSSQLLTLSSPSSSSSTSPCSSSSVSLVSVPPRPTSLYGHSSFSGSPLLSAKSDTDLKILSAPIIVPENMTRVREQYLQSQLSQIVLPPLEDSKKDKENDERDLDRSSNRDSVASAVSISSSGGSSRCGTGNSIKSAVPATLVTDSGSQTESRKKMTTGLTDRIRLFERA
ncbi:hypothetical protein BGW41_003498 [Actinomortierella wolfii]|nr:hypothetical protein BGW41_003498 [Actinomortierella wolfii]